MIDWDALANYSRNEILDVAEDVAEVVEEKLARIRLGVYDEERDGNLLTVLEEIEGILR